MTNREETFARFSKARTWLIGRMPFFGHLALNLKLDPIAGEDQGVETACIFPTGDLILNDKFVASLTDAHFRFVLAHEVLHPALLCHVRRKGRDHLVFNMAHDYAINLIITEAVETAKEHNNCCMPLKGLIDNAYRGLSAEEIYDKLLEQASTAYYAKGGFEQDVAEKEAKTEDKEQDSIWKMRLAAASVAASRAKRGTIPAGLQKIIQEILQPQVYWLDVLAEYVSGCLGGDIFTYSRLNRRSEGAGCVLAGKISDEMPEVTVLWDTSGSQQGWEDTVFAELKKLQDDMAVPFRLMIIDTALYADMMVDDVDDALSQLKGGGGSDFRPAFTKLEEENNQSVVIAFTDGAISVPETPPPLLKDVIWVLTGHYSSPPAQYGRSIYIEKGKSK